MKNLTLEELGPRLPIGVPTSKGLIKPFTLRPYKTSIDRNLGRWMDANAAKFGAEAFEAAKVTKLISLLLASLGDKTLPFDEDGDSMAETEIALGNWYLADVLYFLFYSRVKSLGPDYEFALTCPNNRCDYATNEARFDLNSVDVGVVESLKELTFWITLKHPFTLRDGKTKLRKVKVEPVKFFTLLNDGAGAAVLGGHNPITLQNCISAVNEEQHPYTMTPAEIDEFHRVDRLIIDRTAQKVGAGPDIVTVLPCPKCRIPITTPLQWTYTFFFDTSFPLEI